MSLYYAINMDKHIAHHGVPNMKHGKRRYQNPDGSLTPLGRVHYKKMRKQREKHSAPSSSKVTRSITDYSTQELQSMTARNRAENDYYVSVNNLRNSKSAYDYASRSSSQRTKEALKKMAKKSLAEATTEYVKPIVRHKIKKSINKYYGEKIFKI